MPPPSSPKNLVVFEDAREEDFSSVVSLLISHGAEPVEAQRCVCNLVKAKSQSKHPVEFFELYGQGGLKRGAQRYPGLNVRGLQVLDLRTLRPDDQP